MFVSTDAGGRKAAVSISCRSYKNMVPTVAMARYKRGFFSADRAVQFVALPLTGAGDARTVVEELRRNVFPFPPMAVAFIPLGSDVLAITFSAPADEPYKQNLAAFLELLKSYKEVIS